MQTINRDKNNKLRTCVDGHSYVIYKSGESYYYNRSNKKIVITKLVKQYLKKMGQSGGGM